MFVSPFSNKNFWILFAPSEYYCYTLFSTTVDKSKKADSGSPNLAEWRWFAPPVAFFFFFEKLFNIVVSTRVTYMYQCHFNILFWNETKKKEVVLCYPESTVFLVYGRQSLERSQTHAYVCTYYTYLFAVRLLEKLLGKEKENEKEKQFNISPLNRRRTTTCPRSRPMERKKFYAVSDESRKSVIRRERSRDFILRIIRQERLHIFRFSSLSVAIKFACARNSIFVLCTTLSTLYRYYRYRVNLFV